MDSGVPNPINPEVNLKRPLDGEQSEEAHPPQPILAADSAVTQAEKVERNGASVPADSSLLGERASKRVKLEQPNGAAHAEGGEVKSNGVNGNGHTSTLTSGESTASQTEVAHTTQSNGIKKETNGESTPIDNRNKQRGIAMVKPELVIVLITRSSFAADQPG